MLLGLTALAVAAIRGSSAATKHLVWFLGTLGVLVLPLASALLPGWHFILPWQAAAQRQSAATERVAAAERPLPPPSPLQMNEAKPRAAVSRKSSAWPSGVAPAAPMPAAIEPRPAIAWRTLAGRVWLAVSALILAYVVLGMISLWRLRRRSRPLADASWLALVDELRRQLGIGQPVNLLVSNCPLDADDLGSAPRLAVVARKCCHLDARTGAGGAAARAGSREAARLLDAARGPTGLCPVLVQPAGLARPAADAKRGRAGLR